MDIMQLLTSLGFNAQGLMGAMIASVVIIMLNDKETSFRSAVAQIAAAAAFGGYGPEFIIHYYKLNPAPSTCGIVGFLLGLGGLFLARSVIKLFKKFESNPGEALRTLLPQFLKRKTNNDDHVADP